MTRPLIALLVLPFLTLAANGGKGPETANPYEAVDRHALAAPPVAERSVPALATYLTRPWKTDKEKVRALFRWMTDRIAYNAEDFLAGRPFGDVSAEGVLTSRKSVCEGYGNLFLKLAQAAGLEAVKLAGHSKGFSYRPGEKVATNHAWNAVKIDGAWHLLDATWGAGYVDAKEGFVKELDEHYFLTPPDHFVFNHFPEDPRWQLLDPPVPKETYAAWPRLEVGLFRTGASGKDLQALLAKKDFRGLVHTFSDTRRIRQFQGPLEKHLSAGKAYRFRIEAPSCLELAIVNGENWHYATVAKGAFEVTVMPEAGSFKVCGRYSDKEKRFWTMLEYVVE